MTWHTTTRIAANLYRISEPFGAIEPRVGATTANMYLVIGQERAALIDSGMGIGDVRNDIITGRDWLGELAEGVEAAVAGKVAGQPRDDLIVGREFRFGVFSVWLPQ